MVEPRQCQLGCQRPSGSPACRSAQRWTRSRVSLRRRTSRQSFPQVTWSRPRRGRRRSRRTPGRSRWSQPARGHDRHGARLFSDRWVPPDDPQHSPDGVFEGVDGGRCRDEPGVRPQVGVEVSQGGRAMRDAPAGTCPPQSRGPPSPGIDKESAAGYESSSRLAVDAQDRRGRPEEVSMPSWSGAGRAAVIVILP